MIGGTRGGAQEQVQVAGSIVLEEMTTGKEKTIDRAAGTCSMLSFFTQKSDVEGGMGPSAGEAVQGQLDSYQSDMATYLDKTSLHRPMLEVTHTHTHSLTHSLTHTHTHTHR